MPTTMQVAVKQALGWVPRTEPRRKKNRKLFIVVNGAPYLVFKSGGQFRALLRGLFGWHAVWADTYEALGPRIKRAKMGGQ